jgi:hypothetical protein
MNLEHCRKDAKRLVRGVAVGDAVALARAGAVLGHRVDERFGLSDAQHVVARERGYRSWPELTRAASAGFAAAGGARPAASPPPDESVVDSGMEYRPGDPVRVWVRRRERRVTVSDHGAALQRAGAAAGWRGACVPVHAEFAVNITRAGVVWLPVVPMGPGEPEVVRRIARASLTFYQELLELT